MTSRENNEYINCCQSRKFVFDNNDTLLQEALLCSSKTYSLSSLSCHQYSSKSNVAITTETSLLLIPLAWVCLTIEIEPTVQRVPSLCQPRSQAVDLLKFGLRAVVKSFKNS